MMMICKKNFWLVLVLILLVTALALACGEPKDDGEGEEEKISVTGISLSANTLSLFEGESQQLVPIITPDNATNKKVHWTSTNYSVANVSGGLVTGMSAGTATITATTDDGGFKATCEVTVSQVTVESVTLRRANKAVTTISLKTTQQTVVTATVSPENASDQTLTWSSSDETKVKVLDGVITAMAEGSATITATSSNGKTASCTVNVTQNNVDYSTYIAINSVEDYLNFVNNADTNKNKKFYLTQDLDFEGEEVRSFGTQTHQLTEGQQADNFVTSFTGVFDGMGYSIKNARFVSELITSDSYQGTGSNGQVFVAMFGKLDGSAVVRNLGFEDCTFAGHLWVGAVAGIIESGTVENIYINAEFDTQHQWYDAWCWGGAVTSINRGVIRNIVVNSTTDQEGENWTKGVAGVSLSSKDSITCEIVYVFNTGAWPTEQDLTHTEADPSKGLNPRPLLFAEIVSEDDTIIAATYKYLNEHYWDIEDGSIPTLKKITP